jgi:SAM-dependent methyltransferase
VPENHFGEQVAARYDDDAEIFEPAAVDPVVDFLAGLAGDGAALELGIGTGRIALPLARRGVRVSGIDLSNEMVARLRAKPGAEEIGVTIGDFATTTVDGTFSVAYVVYNTIGNLTTQAAQVACFRNVAAHLARLDAVPLRLAVGARPDGRARRDAPSRALERLEARAVHEREHDARLRLGEEPGDSNRTPGVHRRQVPPGAVLTAVSDTEFVKCPRVTKV